MPPKPKFSVGQPLLVRHCYSIDYRVLDKEYHGASVGWMYFLQGSNGSQKWELEELLGPMRLGTMELKRQFIRRVA
jgi:hypothetical protein